MPDSLPVTIFFLYAPEDEELRAALDKHLAQLKRDGLVSSWSDRMVTPGAEWRSEIERRFNDAQIILVLISADFIASESYDEEWQRAYDRHRTGRATVIPVLARPVDWSTGPFHDLLPMDQKPLTQHADRDAALEGVAKKIRGVIEAIKKRSQNPRVAHRLLAPSR
jgi:hypothetical protein